MRVYIEGFMLWHAVIDHGAGDRVAAEKQVGVFELARPMAGERVLQTAARHPTGAYFIGVERVDMEKFLQPEVVYSCGHIMF